MKTLLTLLLIAGLGLSGGCAGVPQARPWPQEPMPEEPMPEEPMPDAPPQRTPDGPMWAAGSHPVGLVRGTVGAGEFSYKTFGSSNDKNTDGNARLYRFAYMGRAGVMLDFIDTSSLSSTGLNAESFDFFGFANIPLWPNDRMRVVSRAGWYVYNINLKGAGSSDVEPWSVGFRYELELEVDIIRRPPLLLSAFASGRFGLGWGDAKTGGIYEGITSLDWGYEVGARVHWGHFYGALTWLDRTYDIDGLFQFSSAKYGYQGVNLSLGMRW